MLLVLLLACLKLLKSALKIIKFVTYPPLGCVKLRLESNRIPYPDYLYLSISVFFVNLTVPNRQSSIVTQEPLVVGINLSTI